MSTAYVLPGDYTPGPRCRNTHTLAPLFEIRGPSNELITDPVPLSSVPENYFWQNSDGYGFDLRNLYVLLQTNFRNLNPHTVDSWEIRPLWCNQRDLASLLEHLPVRVKTLLAHRVAILNSLSDETKRKLANLANELYSYDYSNLFRWLRDVPDDVLQGLSVETSREQLLNEIRNLSLSRRNAAIQGIQQNVGTQANQHFVEPAGVTFGSDLYRMMEYYKANVTQEFLTYVDQLSDARILTSIQDFDDRIMEYMQLQFLGLCARYATVIRRIPHHFNLTRLWHWVFKVPTAITTAAVVAGRRHGLRSSIAAQRTAGEREVHVRISLYNDSGAYEISIEDPLSAQVVVFCADSAELWHRLRERTFFAGAKVHMAALAGGLYEICLSPLWKRTLKRDNRLISTMASFFTMPQSPMRAVHECIQTINSTVFPIFIASEAILRVMGPKNKLAMGVRIIIEEFMREFPRIYERYMINAIAVTGGYDNQGLGNLITKLRGALAGTTCIQDVAAELCEFLSVPYPPERPEFAQFQVDHTSIPPLIRM